MFRSSWRPASYASRVLCRPRRCEFPSRPEVERSARCRRRSRDTRHRPGARAGGWESGAPRACAFDRSNPPRGRTKPIPSNFSAGARPVSVAKRSFQQLPRGVAWKLIGEIHRARLLVAGEALPAKRDQLLAADAGIASQLNHRLHRLAELLVRHADDGSVDHRGMRVEHRLDLGGVDVDPARDDHVDAPIAYEVVALIVPVRDVADREESIVKALGGRVGTLVVLGHPCAADHEFARFTDRALGAVLAQQPDFLPRDSSAARTRLAELIFRTQHRVDPGLGCPVALPPDPAELIIRAHLQRVWARSSAEDERAKR